METQITINFTTIIFAIVSIVISIFGFFIVRIVRGYDKQISELFDRTKDMPGIKADIEWIKCEIKGR